MSEYYYLVAGLPNISFEDTKIPFTTTEFREELDDALTKEDKKLMDLFFLKYDNKNLVAQARFPDSDPDPRGRIKYQEFKELFDALKAEEKPPVNINMPPYFEEFFKMYIAAEAKEEKKVIPWEDILAALYYGYAMKCKNKFFAAWFELSLNVNNMLTAITCRKYELNRADYIVGDNEIAQSLRTSNARDFGLGDTADYIQDVQRIAEETNLLARERKVDQLKWHWLEDNTFFKPFTIEKVFAYLLELEMIERWVTLDRAEGEKTFRKLVGAMKKGSDNALEEFKRNNKK